MLKAIDARVLLLDAGVVESELRLLQGDLLAAERACQQLLRDSQEIGAEVSEAQARCVLGPGKQRKASLEEAGAKC